MTSWLRERAAAARGLLLLAVACGMAGAGAIIIQAGLLAWIIHAVVIDGLLPGDLLLPFLLLAGAVTVRAIMQWSMQAAGTAASQRIRREVRSALIDHLATMGPAGLAHEHSSHLASRIVEQIDALDLYFARFRPQLWLAVAVPILIAVIVLALDWLAALILILAAPLIPLFMTLVGMGAERLNRDQFAMLERLSSHFLDRLRGLSTLRLFGRGPDAVQDVHARADDYRRRSMRTLRVAFLSSAVLEFFSSVAIATLAIYIGFGLLGYFTFGPATELTLFSGLFILLLAPEFFQPLRTLAWHYHDRAAALGAAAELAPLHAASTQTTSSPLDRPPPFANAPPSLHVHGIDAGYPGRVPVFQGLSLDVPAGACIAISGASGSGKTTLLQLLAGFLAPQAGTIKIANQAPGLTGSFAWLGQQPLILPATLAENIRLGSPDAADEAVARAADAARVTDYAERLPAGLDTRIGERGYGLSGGQVRRLALARVFLSPAPLVLLDEPTASLDAATEEAVIDSLQRLMQTGRTVVIATHHPAVMALADRVVTVRDGGIVEGDAHA